MNVLSVAYPLFPVSSDAPGGAEQILCYIDSELVRAGHNSLVLAAAGSTVAGKLIEASPPGRRMTETDRREAQAEYADILQRCVRSRSIDVIHFHGLDFHTYVPETTVPMLATLHLPISWYPSEIFDLPGIRLNCVSHTQAAERGLRVISNGVDLDFFRPSDVKEDYLLWLGRICPEKGVHIALRVAHALDVPLIIAGPVHPLDAHRDYYEAEVRPLLDSKRVHCGPVGREEKQKLLNGAKCLIVPSLVDETSSLVSMESISCGTPVVAFQSGALPEVIDHGVTGFIASSQEEMIEYVHRTSHISPDRCRREALARFDARRMAREYLALHAMLMRRATVRV